MLRTQSFLPADSTVPSSYRFMDTTSTNSLGEIAPIKAEEVVVLHIETFWKSQNRAVSVDAFKSTAGKKNLCTFRYILKLYQGVLFTLC